MFSSLTVTITILFSINFIVAEEQRSLEQIETTSIKPIDNYGRFSKYLQIALAKKAMGTSNSTSNSSDPTGDKIDAPPPKLLQEYVRCRHLNLSQVLPAKNWCPYNFDDQHYVCWKPTQNANFATETIEYEHYINPSYEEIIHQVENCTIKRFCSENGTWEPIVSPDIQCRNCSEISQFTKFNDISIKVETMSLSICLFTLTIALLCMINVKRLHFPRNLLHMHLFFAFICRSIVKLIFIHTIVAGYPYWMIEYTTDHCGNINFMSKSSKIFHYITCRLLSSLYWYTDAVSQTFIFCEAMFLFTALTSHLFRDRGCLLFVLWGWLSPLAWLTMWIASHIITDRIQGRSTCWLENDKTAQFLYFFHVPYVSYLLVNCGIFIYLVRLLYNKYQSSNVQNNRSGNRHLIKSIFILIPLFGLHLLFTIGPFYKQGEGATAYYYFVIIFKAIFGDLQGFFTSLIYFYMNTEIRQEVSRQFQRSLLLNDTVRRGSNGEMLTNRFRLINFSLPNIVRDRRRSDTTRNSEANWSRSEVCCKKLFGWLCPCLLNWSSNQLSRNDQRSSRREMALKPIQTSCLTSPTVVQLLTIDEETGQQPIEREGTTCDTLLIKKERESEDVLSDENDVTYQQTSFTADQSSIIVTSTPVTNRHPKNNKKGISENDGLRLSTSSFNESNH